MTDLLVIIVAVLFVLVLLDGLRRKWSDRNRVVLKLDKSVQGGDVNEEEFTRSELPNGGARTKPRASDQIPRPPKPAPKLKVVELVRKRRQQAQAQHVPVLLDSVEVEEERIEHTNVFADSNAVPVSAVDTSTVDQTREEETMGIYQAEIDNATDEAIDGLDEEFLDLTADVEADRTLVTGKGGDDDEDEWEEEWEDEEEDDEEDEEEEEIDVWEEPWTDDEDEEDDEDEDDEDDEDEYEDDEEEDEDDDDEDLDEDDDDEEDEDDVEPFPDYDEEDGTWNRGAAAVGSRAAASLQHAVPAARPQPQRDEPARPKAAGRVDPDFGNDELDTWEFESDPGVGAADYEEFAPAAEEQSRTRRTLPKGSPHGRKPMFGTGFLSKKDQGELFREEPDSADGTAAGAAKADTPQEVIVINVMARNGRSFEGYDLLPILQLQGLRLGDMSIFHKHSGSNGSGSVLFSMANMVKPGTFDLASMDSFVTPGVSFFLQLPNKYGNMASFDQMLTAANAIKHALDGELKDENRSVLTRQTLEHYKQRIRDFELMLLSSRR
jgi:cell division protein ZipA